MSPPPAGPDPDGPVPDGPAADGRVVDGQVVEGPMSDGPAADRRGTRGAALRGATLGLLALGAGLGLIAAAQPWWRASGGATQVGLAGNEVSGGLTQALALVAAAGLLLCLVLQTTGRRVLGVVLALMGAGMVAAAGYRFQPGDQAVLGRLREVGLVDAVSLVGTAWPLPYGIAGGLVLTGGALLVLTGRRWPVRSDRFARTGDASGHARQGGSGGDDAGAPLTDPLLAWQALDAGQDPTAPPSSGDPAGRRTITDTPDVQSAGSGETMEPTYDTPGPHDPAERRTT